MLVRSYMVMFILHLGFSGLLNAAEQQGTPVRTAAVIMKEMQKRSVVTGTVRAKHRVELSFQEAGILQQLVVREGERVKKGQTLAQLDARRLSLARDHAELAMHVIHAELEKAKISLQSLEKEFQRRKQASDTTKGSISEEILEQAESRVAISRADFKIIEHKAAQARKDLALADIQLADTKLLAPFDGVVINKVADLGAWLAPGQAVLHVISDGNLEAVFDVPAQQALGDVTQMKALRVLRSGSTETILCESFRVIPDVDPRSRRYELIAELPGADTALVPGMSVTCAVASSAQNTYTLVPTDALMRDKGGAYVYTAATIPNMGTVAMAVSVQVLFIDDLLIAVSSDALKEHDQVVIEGNERLRPMTPLQILEGK